MSSNLVSLLNLDRPLVVFDTETTGLSVLSDRIIELAYIKYFPDGREERADILLNPEQPIPPASTTIHGISDADVADAPTFKDKADELLGVFKDAMFSGFNVSGFDLPMLRQEFKRAGCNFSYRAEDILDTKTIYHFFEPRTLASAYKYYCNEEHADSHNALSDTVAAAEVMAAQIQRYGADKIKEVQANLTPEYVDGEQKFYWQGEEVCFAFSKFKHQPLRKVVESDRGFVEWITTADFSDEVKKIVRDALKGKFPDR